MADLARFRRGGSDRGAVSRSERLRAAGAADFLPPGRLGGRSERSVRTHRSEWAFALGARTGVRITLTSSDRNASLKPPSNLESRSWNAAPGNRRRTWSPIEESSSRTL